MRLDLLILTCLLLAACGGGGTEPEPPPADLYVDAVNGDDGNPGTEAQPLKTITHALSIVQSGEDIRALDGLYDSANGESFPLIIPPDVTLFGSEHDRGLSQVIQGSGVVPAWAESGSPASGPSTRAAVVLSAGATLAGMEVKNWFHTSDTDVGVVLPVANATLRRCRVRLSQDIGIWIQQSADGCSILGSVSEMHGVGLRVSHMPQLGEMNLIEDSRFTFNAIGVRLDVGSVDLGGGSLGSGGGNTFAWNDEVDLLAHVSAGTVSATNCAWDHTPPTQSNSNAPPAGVDINELSLGAAPANVVHTGATLAQP